MKISLDKDNYDKTINVYCSKIKGSIKLVYIDVDTNEVIKTHTMEDLELGEHDVRPSIKGYDIVDYEEQTQKEQEIIYEKEEIEEDINKEDNSINVILSMAKELGIDM